MKFEYILIVIGEPYSIFSEILGKYFYKKFNKNYKYIIIGNKKLFSKQLEKLKYKFKLNEINSHEYAKRNCVNFINIDYSHSRIFKKISNKSSTFIEKCFQRSLDIINKNKNCVLINGPVSKKSFLKKKYLGITEYLSKKTQSSGEIMLIYNRNLSVSPLTTHIPIKHVAKKINKKKIILHVSKINEFYRSYLNKKPKIAVLGLNPHCETIDKFSEDDKIITPAIKILKNKKIYVKGPFSADTFFLKENFSKFNIVLGMYHDQVLTPIKTLYRFNAINVTIGLPFIRISPDHGPNSLMVGKDKSDPSSFFYAMKFINSLK